MKIFAKCSAFISLFYQVHVKVCNPIPLIYKFMTYKYIIKFSNQNQYIFLPIKMQRNSREEAD